MCPPEQMSPIANYLYIQGDPTIFDITPNGSLIKWWCKVVKNRAPPLFMRVPGHIAEIFRK